MKKRQTPKRRARAAAKPARESPPRAPLIFAHSDDHEAEATVPVTVRAVLAYAKFGRSKSRSVRVRVEEPIDRQDAARGNLFLAINVTTDGDPKGDHDIALFGKPDLLLALARCVSEAIEGARYRGMLPPTPDPASLTLRNRLAREGGTVGS